MQSSGKKKHAFHFPTLSISGAGNLTFYLCSSTYVTCSPAANLLTMYTYPYPPNALSPQAKQVDAQRTGPPRYVLPLLSYKQAKRGRITVLQVTDRED